MKIFSKTILLLLLVNISFGQDIQPKKINDIIFYGKNSFDVKQLRNVLRIHESRFLSKMDFDRRLIKLDAINIKTFYVSQGYLGVDVKDSVSFSNDFVDIYFIINEGKRYYLRNIFMTGNDIITNRSIAKTLGLILNKAYNPIKTNTNSNILEEKYRNKGKLFSPIKITDTIMDSVDISVQIVEGPDVHINNTFFTGQGVVDSNIVKRELLFGKGDKYNQTNVIQSQRQLIQTGIFSVANITPVKIAKSDSLVNMLVELRQLKQFEWLSEGGYYPIEYYEGTEPEPGAGVLVEWKNRSLFGSATSFSTKLSGQTLISDNSLNPKFRFDVSLSNPWIYNLKIPTKAQIYLESFKDYISLGSPYVTRYGIELVNTYFLDKIERRSYIETRLYLDRFSRKDYLNIENILLNTSKAKQINVEKHSFEINFRLDNSDNVLYPKEGLVYTGQLNGTGGILGGNRDFIKLDLGVRGYKTIIGEVVFASQLKYGMIVGWDTDYHDYLYDKFYLGGSNSLRGWDMLRYQTDGSDLPSGEIIRILTNYEIRFPLIWLLGGELFLDGGHIYDSYNNISINDLSWDGGFGITLATPLGPVRLDAAKALTDDMGWKIQLGVQYIF
jgi:outer membrane protein insertion porin family